MLGPAIESPKFCWQSAQHVAATCSWHFDLGNFIATSSEVTPNWWFTKGIPPRVGGTLRSPNVHRPNTGYQMHSKGIPPKTALISNYIMIYNELPRFLSQGCAGTDRIKDLERWSPHPRMKASKTYKWFKTLDLWWFLVRILPWESSPFVHHHVGKYLLLFPSIKQANPSNPLTSFWER